MRVGLIHIRYVHKGGLETRLSNYLKFFASRGDEVTLFTSKIAPDIKVPSNVEIELLDVSVIPKFMRPLWFNFKLCPVVRRQNFDFVLSLERTYCQDHVLAPSTHAGFVRRLRKRFLLPGDFLQLYLDRRSFRSSKRIYACSKMVKEEIITHYGVEESKIRVLFPPINTERFHPLEEMAVDSLRHSMGIPDDAFVCLFVSTGHKRKGLDLVTALAEKMDNSVFFLVAGTPFHTNRPNLKSLGFIRDMNVYYNLADLTIHPAYYEPFGQIISESLATCTPVLVSPQTGAKEILNSKVGGVVKGMNPDRWKEAIQAARETPFDVPSGLVKDFKLDLNSHMESMLEHAILDQ